MICADCDYNFKPASKGDNQCPNCGHVMMRRKSKKMKIAAQASSHVSKTRKAPSLPTFSFLNDQND